MRVVIVKFMVKYKEHEEKDLTRDTYPICCSHLYDDLNCCPAEVSSVTAHNHCTSLTVPQVDGRQNTLDIVLQVVFLALEHCRLFPESISPWFLVIKRCCLDGNDRDRVGLHYFNLLVA